MSAPEWYSQPFSPEGSSPAEGIRNQLGRPDLDLLTVLVRESAQNSWDARIPGGLRPVEYSIELRTVGPAHSQVWRDLLLQGSPPNEHLPLRTALQSATPRVLIISDKGTGGLGGPTRADAPITKGHDFASFVRNTGEPRDVAFGGGTYGFGKGIFYLVSKVGTILVYTRCCVESGLQSRMIGCALLKSYIAVESDGKTRYTGRHWWGHYKDGLVEPLLNLEAESTARRLGLEPFAEDETGTKILVIAPDLEELEPAEAAEYLAETITWNLWPKMLATPEHPPAMRFSVRCDGIEVAVPDPYETPPLNMFLEAFRDMDGPEGRELRCHRPKRLLGRLGLVKKVVPPAEPSRASRMSGIDEISHHICLMRPAELVVTYHPGPKPPSEYLAYAGVFRADNSMDGVYSKAEPPTHDAWHPKFLPLPDSTFVSSTFTRIGEQVTNLLNLTGTVRGSSAGVALGAASRRFSSLVSGAWGTGGATDFRGTSDMTSRSGESGDSVEGAKGTGESGSAGQEHDGGGGRTARRRPRVDYVGDARLEDRSGETVIIQEFRLPVPGAQRLSVDLAVALRGTAREAAPPADAAVPTLIGWEDPAGRINAESEYVVEGGTGDLWRALIRPAHDTVTEINISVREVRGA